MFAKLSFVSTYTNSPRLNCDKERSIFLLSDVHCLSTIFFYQKDYLDLQRAFLTDLFFSRQFKKKMQEKTILLSDNAQLTSLVQYWS